MYKNFFEEIKTKMESPEFILRMDAWVDKIRKKDEIYDKQLERFHKGMTQEKFDKIVEKVQTKYNSDKYYLRHIKQGFEPPRDLEHFLYHYAVKFGTHDEDMFEIWGCKFNIVYGQGSRIIISNRK